MLSLIANHEKIIKGLISTIIVIGLVAYFYGGGIEYQAEQELQRIENKVAQDLEEQYKIAKNNGSAMDTYVAASQVVAAYLQANDEANYKKWKEIETEEAKKVGIK